MHPYKKHAHKNDPKWVSGLNKYVEPANKADVTDVIKNYGGDRKTTADAAYEPLDPREKD